MKQTMLTGSTLLNGWKYKRFEVTSKRPGLQTKGVILDAKKIELI